MKHLLIFSAILILLGAPTALAAEGFVIEAEMAQPEVGVQLRGDTQITIDSGGHMVVMTQSGQMIRKDGPFKGVASDIMAGIGGSDAEMEGGLLESLLELAEVSGMSEEQLGAVRGMTQEDIDSHPNAISTAVSVFCMKEGELPEFHTSEAPAVDEPLIVRRRVRPIQFLQTTWPAGATSLQWPADWAPAEEGRYIWALGNRGTSGLRIVVVEEGASSPLERAALYYDHGCEIQARSVFRAALANAQQ